MISAKNARVYAHTYQKEQDKRNKFNKALWKPAYKKFIGKIDKEICKEASKGSYQVILKYDSLDYLDDARISFEDQGFEVDLIEATLEEPYYYLTISWENQIEKV